VQVDRSEEIDVPRWPSVGAEPVAEEQCALEDEPVPVKRASEAVEETLQCVQFEQLRERAFALLRLVPEAGQHRVRESSRSARAYWSASRYGRMIRSTRQVRAARRSSAGVALRSSSPVRRASTATSMPRRMRKRKQSAIVFAAP